jgi:hypothetical protein
LIDVNKIGFEYVVLAHSDTHMTLHRAFIDRASGVVIGICSDPESYEGYCLDELVDIAKVALLALENNPKVFVPDDCDDLFDVYDTMFYDEGQTPKIKREIPKHITRNKVIDITDVLKQ